MCRYHAQTIPPRGSEFVFHPLEHLQAIQYIRHSVDSLGFKENFLDCSEPAEVILKSFLTQLLSINMCFLYNSTW